MSFNIDVVVMIKDYHHCMGGGGRPFIKELLDSPASCACNDCNGSTICIYTKLQSDSNVLRIHILHVMKGSLASTMAQSR